MLGGLVVGLARNVMRYLIVPYREKSLCLPCSAKMLKSRVRVSDSSLHTRYATPLPLR